MLPFFSVTCFPEVVYAVIFPLAVGGEVGEHVERARVGDRVNLQGQAMWSALKRLVERTRTPWLSRTPVTSIVVNEPA